MMKKLIFMLSSLLMLVFYTCTQDEGIVTNSSGTVDQKNTHSHRAVITVNPSGGDDTQLLTEAFEDARSLGPGSVVKLSEGLFRIGFIEIRDFHGYFMGSGKAKTRIQNLDIMPSCHYFFSNAMIPMLLNFVGGEVNISQMTLTTTDGPVTPDDPVYGMLEVMVGLSDFTTKYVPPKQFIKATIENVDFIGGIFDGTNSSLGTDHNLAMAVFIGANATGANSFSHEEITIKHCGFYHVGVGPDVWGLDDGSKLIFEDNISKNTYYNMFVGADLGLKAYITNNQWYEAPLGIILDNSDYGIFPAVMTRKRSEFYISGNFFHGLAGSTNLTMIDSRRILYPEEGSPQLFEVRGNIFNAQGDANAILCLNTVGTKIWNNKFTGNSVTGVFIDGNARNEIFATDAPLIGNNFSGGTYSNAAVYLGPWTKHCKLTGTALDNVTDLGSGNKVIGVNANQNGQLAIVNNPRIRSIQELKMRQHKFQTR